MFRRPEDVERRRTRLTDTRPLRHLLVTGGLGFIGSNFINHLLRTHSGVHVYNLDKVDYCSSFRSIENPSDPYYHFVRGNITNADLVMYVLRHHDIDTIINFAAQSHVDNSFGNSLSFTYNNVLGTHVLLECARTYGRIEKFIHVSTDEVYGQVTDSKKEEGTLNPTNPYAATKAAVEYIVKSYHISFGLPCIITRGNNVYGPYQYPEKLIPRFIMLMNAGKKLTIQGNGSNKRTFIHASDVARAFVAIINHGFIGDVYNIGSCDEKSVLDIARMTVKYVRAHKCGEREPLADPSEEEVSRHLVFVKDREFNDERYDISVEKLQELGWRQEVRFEEGYKETVAWYLKAFSQDFWENLRWDIPDAHAPCIGELELLPSRL
ncbi:putative GDP-mannose 4,6 dehydratase [Trypanosoma cruzi]|uniref:GDP-mannose 4,6 dehydratase, putative n=3 Tax=Trypanosoma cruzi TaxID=5693 RepID=Q4CYB9_TRYCC|nr:GDP-mannose 4,6 dehydratase, putative [Trypanosoma cruzi]EAN85269.1 GDP-mannose 4,6 dehydratase, putative [Trypanosoma cruzi]KAF8296614.1 putative GDP-mannose 4,6 dehydratase [Trypanosoma cruzi]PWV07860.1 putative GDP-mannose 4,6 dehydratase [Trypanosoma cruzi]RNC50879.1 putative GDP-mannose 4,6 dehydratase [Trypanosoma cruzi]|eukprot:XP_807120.1 GDP-mannose 4,6 dehydratase [Trypanosoma cruzi strain CL Brener]